MQQLNTPTGKSAQSGDITQAGVIPSLDITQLLTFDLNGESYGIAIQNIREIIEHGTITKVPMTPGFIAGVINLRGNVVPVVDLSERFSQKSSVHTRKSGIVILEVKHEDIMLEIGVTVDLVTEVLSINTSDIKPAPSFGTSIRADFIQGIVKLEDHMMILLAIDQILSIEELSVISDNNHSI